MRPDPIPCPWCALWRALSWAASTARDTWDALTPSGRRSVSLMLGLVGLVVWAWWSR